MRHNAPARTFPIGRHGLTLGAAVIFVTLAPGLLHAQPLADDSAIHTIAKERVDAKRSSGMVIGYFDRSGTPHIIAYGDPGPGGPPVLDGNSVFEIGSITKTFTATILADMILHGEVKLDDPVAKYLPKEVHVPERNGKVITLLDLATQSSGLPSLPSNFAPKDSANPYLGYTVQQMYDFLSGYQLTRDIGSQYQYSNLGVALLGHALARKAGMSYEELVIKRIADPLGMHDTRIDLTPSMQQRLAHGHGVNGAPVANWDLPTFAGAGALRSTVNDMLKYLAANMDTVKGPLAADVRLAQQSRRPTMTNGLTIGLAWHILATPYGSQIVWHNGGTGGYRTFIGFDHGTGGNVVVLSNSAQGVDDIGRHVIDRRMPLQPASKAPTERKEITLDTATLNQYVGVYEISPQFSLTISREGATLWGQPPGQPKSQLFAESETKFFLKNIDLQITFTKDADGKVTGLVIEQGGSSVPGKKVAG